LAEGAGVCFGGAVLAAGAGLVAFAVGLGDGTFFGAGLGAALAAGLATGFGADFGADFTGGFTAAFATGFVALPADLVAGRAVLRAAGFAVTPFPVTFVLPVLFVAIARNSLRGRQAPRGPKTYLPWPRRAAAVGTGGQRTMMAAFTARFLI
jgi:hypothetical protein